MTRISFYLLILIILLSTRLNAQQDEITQKLTQLENKLDEQGSLIKHLLSGGGLFTRWGRAECPNSVSELVYSGITGGAWYLDIAAAAEFLCLPKDPLYNKNKNFNGTAWGYLYGAEYEDIPKKIKDNEAPCAVCLSNYTSSLMIPARTECYNGWNKAYSGELVSSHHDSHNSASEYICLDEDPQAIGKKKDDDGKLMFPIRTRCGSLPCPPYENNTLVTCVVCVK